MIQFKLIPAVFCGTLLYTLLSVCIGAEGFWAQEQLAAQKEQLYTHLQQIQRLNDELSLHVTALQVDPDMVASYAKNLGYVSPNEYIVRLNGIPREKDFTLQVGTPYSLQSIQFLPDWICKFAGVVCATLVFYGITFVSQRKQKEAEKSVLHMRDLSSLEEVEDSYENIATSGGFCDTHSARTQF